VQFAHSRQLAGTMFWSLEVDDFLGTYCNDGEFPLLTAVYNTIQELAGVNRTTTTRRSTPTTTPPDFRLNHHTNANGINFFWMKNAGSVSGGSISEIVYMIVLLTSLINFFRMKFI
jgi:hypothetical protein